MRNDGIHNGLSRAARLAGGFLLALGMATGAWAQQTPTSLDGVKVVTAAEARKMQDKGVPLIDTRVASEYAEKTIKGAQSLPYREKSAKDVKFDRSQDKFDLAKLPQDKNAPVVFFCNAGECWKSYKASILARDAGYKNVHWLRGGMPEWTAAGLPTQ
jgi:rhodanese-related sulfurtransferase